MKQDLTVYIYNDFENFNLNILCFPYDIFLYEKNLQITIIILSIMMSTFPSVCSTFTIRRKIDPGKHHPPQKNNKKN